MKIKSYITLVLVMGMLTVQLVGCAKTNDKSVTEYYVAKEKTDGYT